MTLGEAQTLNALRADNIREIGRRILATLLAKYESEDGILSPEGLVELTREIEGQDASYEFKPRKNFSKPRNGTLEAETRLVAEEQVEGLVRSGEASLSPSSFDAQVRAFMVRSDIQAEARRRFAARLRATRESIEDILNEGA
jgi:hypothetical protein